MSQERDLSETRREYDRPPLELEDLADSPFEQLDQWLTEAMDANVIEPNAMVLSTVGPDHRPTSRTVLLKYFDHQGLVFFTNYESRKAKQIADNPNVTVLFPWYALQRQVEVNGRAEKISAMETARYFARRPRGSQLGAWVSQQSQVISSRSLLEAKWEELKRKFSSGEIPVPSFWGGFRIRPRRFEFWQGGHDRLHDRFEYLRDSADDQNWIRQRLSP